MLDFYFGQETADDPSAYLGGINMLEMIDLKRLDVIPIERSDYCPNCDCYLSFINDVSLTKEQVVSLHAGSINKVKEIDFSSGFKSEGPAKMMLILEEAMRHNKGLYTLSD